MITFITIFGVSLIATLMFIYVRIDGIRRGSVTVPGNPHTESRKAYTRVVKAKEATTWYGKNFFKLTILLVLKLFVFAGFLFKQLGEEIREFIKEKTTPKTEDHLNKNPSAFIGTIQEYKKELTKFQKQLNKKK